MDKSDVQYEPYTYSTYPRPVLYSGNYNAKNYDELPNRPFYGNIMYDKRIIRGNTWALRRLAKENAEIEEKEERKRLKQKRHSVRKQVIQSKTGYRNKSSFYPNLPDHTLYATVPPSKQKMIEQNINTKTLSQSPGPETRRSRINENEGNDEEHFPQNEIKSSRNNPNIDLDLGRDEGVFEEQKKQVMFEVQNEGLLKEQNEKLLEEVQEERELFKDKELDDDFQREEYEDELMEDEPQDNGEETQELYQPGENVEFEEPEGEVVQPDKEIYEENKVEPPVKSYSEFQCQVEIEIKVPTADIGVQSDLSSMDEFNEAEIKRALAIFVESTLLESTTELELETEINQLRREHELVLSQRERDLERLQRLVSEVKSAISDKEALMTRCDDLEQEKLKLISRQLASEIIQNLVGNSLDKLTANGYIPTLFQLPKYETKTEIQNNEEEEEEEEEEAAKDILKKTTSDELQTAIAADFFPWLNARVWGTGSRTFLSRLLDDVVKLRSAYCRGNAKKFLQTTLETFDETI